MKKNFLCLLQVAFKNSWRISFISSLSIDKAALNNVLTTKFCFLQHRGNFSAFSRATSSKTNISRHSHVCLSAACLDTSTRFPSSTYTIVGNSYAFVVSVRYLANRCVLSINSYTRGQKSPGRDLNYESYLLCGLAAEHFGFKSNHIMRWSPVSIRVGGA